MLVWKPPWVFEDLRRSVEQGINSQRWPNVLDIVLQRSGLLTTLSAYCIIAAQLYASLHSVHSSTPWSSPRKVSPTLRCSAQDIFILVPGASSLFSSYTTKYPCENYRIRLRSKPPRPAALPSQARSRRPDLHIFSGAPPSQTLFNMTLSLHFPSCPSLAGQHVAQRSWSRL